MHTLQTLAIEGVIVDERDLLAMPQLESLTLKNINALIPEPDLSASFKSLKHFCIELNVNPESIQSILVRASTTLPLILQIEGNAAWLQFLSIPSHTVLLEKVKTLKLNNIDA